MKLLVRNKRSTGEIVFDAFNNAVIVLVSAAAILPLLYVVAGSFSAPELFAKGQFILFPTKFSLSSFQYIFSRDTVFRSLVVSVVVTVSGTLVNLAMTSLMAWPLAQRALPGRRVIMLGVTFTMLFHVGMIPNFILVKTLGMVNTLWALIIPNAINALNLILLKNFFQQIPAELEESARMDGASQMRVLTNIIIPLALPALATFTIFYAVGHWNAYLAPVLYINDSNLWPIQVLLRQVVIISERGVGDASQMDVLIPPQTIKMAVIVVAVAPILLVYPFLQRYFTRGILMGSVKG